MNKLASFLFSMFFLTVVLLPAVGLAQSDGDGRRLLREGWALYAKASSENDIKEAQTKLELALQIFQKQGNIKGIGWVNNNLGLIYRSRGDYPKAEDLFRSALEAADKSKDTKLKGNALSNLSAVLRDAGRMSEALEFGQQALELSKTLGDESLEGQALTNLANVHLEQADYGRAEEYNEKALSIARKMGNRLREGWAYNNLGWLYYCRGKNRQAKDYYDKALDIAREVKDTKLEVVALNNFGVLCRVTGHYRKAEEIYQQVLSIATRTGDVKRRQWSFNNLGLVYFIWGKHAQASELYEKALEISKKIGDPTGQARALNNLGLLYASLGQYPKAADYYEMSLQLKRQVSDARGEAGTLNNIGRVYAAWGHYEDAMAKFRQALEISERIGVSTSYSQDLIGCVYLDMGKISEAEPFLKASAAAASLGRLYLLKSDYQKAGEYYRKLLVSAEKTGNSNNYFIAWTGLGKVHEALEEYEKAEEYYEKAMKLTEEIRSSLLPSDRKNFFEVKVGGFDRSEAARGVTRVRMKLNRAAQSIVSSEVTRARSFAENISQRTQTGLGVVPKDVLEKEDHMIVQVAALRKQLDEIAKDKDPERYANLEKEIQKAKEELNSFVEMLWEKYTPYAAVKYPKPIALKDAAVNPDECLVVYDVLGEGVGVKLIRGKQIVETFYKRWNLEDLEKDVKKFLLPFEQVRLGDFDPELAHSLYTRLLARVLAEVPKGTPITIVPDGILAVLPFEALVAAGKAEWRGNRFGDYPTGLTYLGELYPVSYYQSITAMTLARTARKTTPPGERTLVMADPIFGQDDERVQQPVSGKRPRLIAGAGRRIMAIKDQTGLALARLPLTGDLAASIKKLDPERTDLFTGGRASRSALLGSPMEKYRSMIFATHGYFGSDIPGIQEPVLALSFVEDDGDGNGFLRMTEVMGMKLNAEVVALTACQSGLGKNLAGEGVMSMGRAFQYAGAESVLMSLWSVAESSSVQLVEAFFRLRRSGKGKLEALRLAREEIRKSGYEHPFFWAAFILVGEGK